MRNSNVVGMYVIENTSDLLKVFDFFDERLHSNLVISVLEGIYASNINLKRDCFFICETVMRMFSKQLDPSSVVGGLPKIISNAKLKSAQDISDISRTPLTLFNKKTTFASSD